MKMKRICTLAAVLLLAACPKADDANGIADQFVDAYYLEFSLEKAVKFTEGAATRRIEREQELASKVRAQGGLRSAKAKVYYSDPEHRSVREDLSHHTYTLETAIGTELMKNRVLIMTAKKDGKWKVIAFREMDRPRIKGNPEGVTSKKPVEGVEITKSASTATTSSTSEVKP